MAINNFHAVDQHDVQKLLDRGEKKNTDNFTLLLMSRVLRNSDSRSCNFHKLFIKHIMDVSLTNLKSEFD